MTALNRNTAAAESYPDKVIQFGEGNFLRAFADWIIWKMDKETGFNGGVTVVQPIAHGKTDILNRQDGLYYLNLQGIENGKETDTLNLIDVINRGINPYSDFDSYLQLAENPGFRFIISNTTEAGIAFDPSCRLTDRPASSYPGKLTQLLYRRYTCFNGDPGKGFIIFPCELISDNGNELRKCICRYIEHWNLDEGFRKWFDTACGIYSTLVDRIVPGYPADSIDRIQEITGHEDGLADKAEIFHLWVIEAPEEVAREFPADKAGLNVLFVPDEKPYHQRKVTLLNGPHTLLSPVGFLSGLDTVKECVEDPVIGKYVQKVMSGELLKTLELPETELTTFAHSVLERFRNPYVRHYLTSIMLNSFPKFRTRDLPGLKTYLRKEGRLPEGIVLGLAAIATFYRGVKRDGKEVLPEDDIRTLELLRTLWQSGDMDKIAEGVLAAEHIWDEDLNRIPGLTDMLSGFLRSIDEKGMRETVMSIVR